MKIRIKIERIEDSEPSFPVEDDNLSLEDEFEVDSATIMMSQGDSRLVSDRPMVEIFVRDKSDDITNKKAFLEWANCYWNEKQPQGSRLRKVTLKFLRDDNKNTCYRSFVIPSAFLASYKEICSEENGMEMSYEASIRSNEKKQEITFCPSDVS